MISNDELKELYIDLAEAEIKLFKWHKYPMPTEMSDTFIKMMSELINLKIEIKNKIRE